jgi:hypothetical protein
MIAPTYQHIGFIAALHGVKGTVVWKHFLMPEQNTSTLKALMISLRDDSYIPFFIKKISPYQAEHFLVEFEEINSREEAKTILNKKVFAPPFTQFKLAGTHEWDFINGYHVYNQDKEKIGIIQSIENNSGQLLLYCQHTQKRNEPIEMILPFDKSMLIQIDENLQTLTMHIADGLTELYHEN